MLSYNELPKFTYKLLAPRYWGLWISMFFFRVILLLPYPVLIKLAKFLTKFFIKLPLTKWRLHIAKTNIKLCFPELNSDEQKKLLADNAFASVMAFFETGMAWFWSDKRIKKWSKIEGLEYLKENAKDGIILIGIHFVTLELGSRILGIDHPGIGVYRPHNNPFMDWIQTRGRTRSNKGMLDRHNVRGMIRAIKSEGETIWYAPDHDYGTKNSVFVPFFKVDKTATTVGSHILIKCSPKSKVIPFIPFRKADNSGYRIIISPPVDFNDCTNEIKTATKMNKIIEKQILIAPEQYMWLHRRFKTRPAGDNTDFYKKTDN